MGNGMTSAKEAAINGFLGMIGIDCPGEAPGDYYDEEGLLVCHKCKTRKQTRVNLSALGERVFPCYCKCELDRIKEAEEASKIESERRIVSSLFKYSIVDERFSDSLFENFVVNDYNKKQLKMARSYVEHFDEMYERGKGLLLYGSPGTGKTYVAACIANALMKKGIPVIATSIIKITSSSGVFGSENERKKDFLENMNRARLLVVDDLGAERDTAYKTEQVFEIIDKRYCSKKPIIVTTNLKMSDMQQCENVRQQRIYERIFEMCHPIKFTGDSWRLKAAEDDYDEIQSILLGGK